MAMKYRIGSVLPPNLAQVKKSELALPPFARSLAGSAVAAVCARDASFVYGPLARPAGLHVRKFA